MLSPSDRKPTCRSDARLGEAQVPVARQTGRSDTISSWLGAVRRMNLARRGSCARPYEVVIVHTKARPT
jgi:hypothetical protein